MIRTTIYLPKEMHEVLRRKAFDEKSSMTQIIIDALQFPNSLDPVRVVGVEELPNDYVVEKPKCDKQFCNTKSEGRYIIMADDGETELDMQLCIFHWNQARKEGVVKPYETL